MVACEIIDDQTGEPNKALTGKITQTANENGLLLLSAGIKGNVLRFLTPLVISDDELQQGLEILSETFKNVDITEAHTNA